MTFNKHRLALAGIAFVVLATRAAAAPVIDWDHRQTAAVSQSGENLRADFQALRERLASEGSERIIYGVPQRPQDPFAGVTECSNIDAKFLRAFTIDEALNFLQPCMQGLSRRYGLPVNAEKGAVGVDGGRQRAAGIQIRVPAAIQPGNHVLMDLSFAIVEQRHRQILGFPAAVISGSLDR